jgi:HSP20 family molecular chaperone IbpA
MTENVMTCKDESTNGASAPERIEAGLSYTPRVDIFESEDEIAIYADMPGCKPDDID